MIRLLNFNKEKGMVSSIKYELAISFLVIKVWYNIEQYSLQIYVGGEILYGL